MKKHLHYTKSDVFDVLEVSMKLQFKGMFKRASFCVVIPLMMFIAIISMVFGTLVFPAFFILFDIGHKAYIHKILDFVLNDRIFRWFDDI